MKVYFNIDYRTNWGESVYIIGDPECLGAGNPEKAVRLENSDDHTWSLAVEFPDDIAPFSYRYAVISESGEIRNEWGHGNRFVPSADKAAVHIFDHWQDMPSDKPYFSTAFTECIRRHSTGADVSPKAGMVTFCVAAPMVPSDCVLAISGESEGLGEWNPAKAIRMTCVKAPLWKANIPASALKPVQQFKFVIINAESGQDVAWENGANRRLSASIVSTDANVIEGLRFIDAQSPWRGAGTAIPVFSLRSEDDFGVGDFLDLMKLVDWAADTGQSFIQILPINDTTMTHTWTDSYPY
ncbi:MAG: 4-alpha-glucanotransferase, partial [Muribaculaceae bacterium]|nr:4-alpha-glucanotransferase [Muribaculaceae bacterium]